MRYLKLISILCIIITTSCDKDHLEPQAFASAENRTAMLCYPDDYWGEIETLTISGKDGAAMNTSSIDFSPKQIPLNGELVNCIEFSVPRPYIKDMSNTEYGDRYEATGCTELEFKSERRDFSLKFNFLYTFKKPADSEITEYGNSGSTVVSVQNNDTIILKDNHTYGWNTFYFNILDIL